MEWSLEWSHGVEFWSGFWSGMESDFEFLSLLEDRILRLTDRQRRSGLGSEFGGNQRAKSQTHILAGVGVNSYHTR